jgi:hypothetical protein
MRKFLRRGILAGALLILLTAAWLFFFYSKSCPDSDCFNKSLFKCSQATYLNKGNWTYSYRIIGQTNGDCDVIVKLVFAGMDYKFRDIVGESMLCSIPLKKVDPPEKDLSYCSGPLKEKLQYLVIVDLYEYITENLGSENE